MQISVGDEKGLILDAAVRRANPALALELGTYCGYGALRIARAAHNAKVYSVELAEANAVNAGQIWEHAGVAERWTRWPMSTDSLPAHSTSCSSTTTRTPTWTT